MESPRSGRTKDVVLLATVTSFEALRHPRRSDLHQFAELFEPLFLASSDEARRQAAAALSQAQNLPESVALLIGSMPIAIAAAFLTRSPAISDAVLVEIVNRQGSQHAAAIARRDNLSPLVVDALVDRHQSAGGQRWEAELFTGETSGLADAPDALTEDARLPRFTPSGPDTVDSISPLVFAESLGPDLQGAAPEEGPAEFEADGSADDMVRDIADDLVDIRAAAPMTEHAEDIENERARVQREEALRQEIKALARVARKARRRDAPLAPASPTHAALLVRFSRTGEIFLFRRTLAASLGASEALAERILLDVSGRQLALSLCALGVAPHDARLVLWATYPHLSQRVGITSKADHLIAAADNADNRERVAAWVRADTNLDDDVEPPRHEPVQASERPADPRRQPAAARATRPDAAHTFGKRSGGAQRG
ncbi:DUF2336 domain-containing protein [Rhizobium sp. RU20A]|uniref:DUF2336 domain-containing protein n=1 Tax=Rhizobium sp. RU20A TaxID=1907412 RepID=UPI001FCED28E|nr:DUF2336 domain-containing protein [Rhizobium sp. RU20A]